MEKVNNINIHDYYKEVLKGKDLTVPAIRSWKLIKDNNQYRTSNTAISEDGKNISYDEMFSNWNSVAKAFASLGIDSANNSRVLVMMPNVARTCDIDYALDMTGAVCDFIDPTTSTDKIKRYIEDEKITDIVSLDLLYAKTLKKDTEELHSKFGIKNIVVCSDKFMNSFMPPLVRAYSLFNGVTNRLSGNVVTLDDVIRNSRYTQLQPVESGSDELSLITHTSGTSTGIGKPIPITDYNRNALVKQHDLVGLDFTPGMKMLHFIPYFAAYGAVNTTHLGLSKGMELQQIPLFRPEDFSKLLLKYKPNIVLANTPAWLSLLKDENLKNCDLSFLECAVSGGTPTSVSQEEEINEFLLKHGSKSILNKGYGLSQLCGCATYSIDEYNHLQSMGVPMPLTDVKIRDISTNKIIDSKEYPIEGEALISAPNMTSGVLDGRTVVETIELDGKKYIPTQDIVQMSSDGTLKFIDRKDRMFPRFDAYNVYPLQIEGLLLSQDEVENCVIVPYFDDEKSGSMPKVYIKLADEFSDIDKESYIKNTVENLFINNIGHDNYQANFRDIPRQWVFVDNIPKNTMGKNDYHNIKVNGIDGDGYKVNVNENNMNVSGIEVSKMTKDKTLNKVIK